MSWLVLLVLAQPVEGTPSTPEEFVATAKELIKGNKLDTAVPLLERCVAQHPTHHPCFRQLGTVYAKLGTQQQDKRLTLKAAAAYRRFLELAPADDPYVAPIKSLVEEDTGPQSVHEALTSWYEEAGQKLKSDPKRAEHVLELGLGFMDKKHPLRPKFEARLKELRKSRAPAP